MNLSTNIKCNLGKIFLRRKFSSQFSCPIAKCDLSYILLIFVYPIILVTNKNTKNAIKQAVLTIM